MNIITRAFVSETPDKALRMNGDEVLVKRFPWGSNWRSVKVAVHWAVPANNANNLYSVYALLGVCPYDSHVLSSDAHWMGISGPYTGGWTHNAGGYYTFSWYGAKKTGKNFSTALITGVSGSIAQIGKRSVAVAQLRKDEYTNQITLSWVTSSGTQDWPTSMFLYMLDQTYAWQVPAAYTSSTQSAQYSAANTDSTCFKYADSLMIAWTGWAPMEVYAYGFALESQ